LKQPLTRPPTAPRWARDAAPHWIPNAFGRGVPVLHPGNAAQPYVRPAIISMKGAKAIGIVKPFYA
jgi:hypothetical protein